MLRLFKLIDAVAVGAIFVSSLALHDNPWSNQGLVIYGSFAAMTGTRVMALIRNNSRANLTYLSLAILAASLGLVSQSISLQVPGKLDLLIGDRTIELVGLIFAAGLVFYAWGQSTLYLVKKSIKHSSRIYFVSNLLGTLSIFPLLKVGEKLDIFRLASPGQYFVSVLVWTVFAIIIRWLGSVIVGRRNAKAEWAPIAAYVMIITLIL